MTKSSFKLKGSLFTLTIMILIDPDIDSIRKQLQMTVQKSPQFFQYAPIVLDVSEIVEQEKIDLPVINQLLREQRLIPIGVRGADEKLKQCALEAGLAILTNSSNSAPEPELKISKKSKVITEPLEKNSSTTKLVTQSIRSGQQVYAQAGDLIVVGSVSPGAEILADGNIHVYGSLRGRVLAGIMGDTSARIFCKSLAAELVSIAGRYLVSENISPVKDDPAMQIFLDNNQLKIEQL